MTNRQLVALSILSFLAGLAVLLVFDSKIATFVGVLIACAGGSVPLGIVLRRHHPEG
jgi:hypothetical protein